MSAISFSEILENEITNLLQEHQSVELVADLLIKKYQLIRLSKAEFESLANFFISAGLLQAFIRFTMQKFTDSSIIPWGHFADALSKSTGGQVDLEIKSAIYFAAEGQNAVAELTKTRAFDEYRPEIEIHRKVKLREAEEVIRKRRQDIQERLDIYRTQNLFSEEDRILNYLMYLEPDNKDLLNQRAQLRERMAQDILSKKFSKGGKRNFYNFIEAKDEETQKILENIFLSMKSTLPQAPYLALDFCIAMLIWEDYPKALEFVSLATNSPQKDWLRAEILLLSRRFVDLLSEIDALEAKYQHDSDALFSANYLRAQALWGLNQRHEAIELMEEMLVARPQYRAAHSLLAQWKEEFL